MSKYSGSYDKVTLGVSEQVPEMRFEGQHFEQVNMISDYVMGLVRRRGSVFCDEVAFSDVVSDAQKKATIEDISQFRSMEFQHDNKHYVLFHRCKAKPANSTAPFMFCVNKETKKILPVSYSNDTITNALQDGGASSAVNIGNFVFFAGNTVQPTYTSTELFDTLSNMQTGAVWVRLGAYSRDFEIKFTIRNVDTEVEHTIEVSHETLDASYPVALDTSDIPFSHPEYQKEINDRVNEYNGLVTQWIGLAAKSIIPSTIAQELVTLIEAELSALPDTSAFTVERSGSTIGIKCNGDWRITALKSNDNGDQTLMRTVFDKVADPAQLSAEHYVGKIVKVIPKKTDKSDGYYVKAEPRNEGQTGLVEVEWVETVATEIEPTNVLVYCTIHDEHCYLAGTPGGLSTMESGIDTTFINFKNRTVGDNITSPLPSFFKSGARISYLGLFQDRLVIASGGSLMFSRTGDYLNWFRQSVLTLPNDDPLEFFAFGSEDDTIVSSVYYNRSLILFGKRKQYEINGQVVLTPTNPNINIIGANEDAVDALPVASGNFVFYSKWRLGNSSLHQLQMGYQTTVPESYENSLQLKRYLKGAPIEIVAVSNPNTIFLRTSGNPHGFYVYNYLDSGNGQGRQFDSWSRWEWDPCLGTCCGMSWDNGDMLVATVREGPNREDTGKLFFVLDQFSFDGEVSDKPYLDSMRPYLTVENSEEPDEWMHPENGFTDRYSIAFDNRTEQFLIGLTYSKKHELEESYPDQPHQESAWVGVDYDSYVVLTNPYIRDESGRSIVNGRLIITRFTVSVADTAGLRAFVTTKGRGEYEIGKGWTGMEIGRVSAVLGQQPISNGSINVPIGRANTEFTCKLTARDWNPLTITAIEWTGQYFYNTRRA